MIGGIGDGFATYLGVLRAIESNKWSRSDLLDWLISEYKLSDAYARNVMTMLLFGTGLVATEGGRCCLTDIAKSLLESASPLALYSHFADQFAGIKEIVEILAERQPLDAGALFSEWDSRIRKATGVNWKASHARMQFTHRIDWLRSLSIVRKIADSFYLSTTAMDDLVRTKSERASSEVEKASISHNDIEDKLRAIGEFFEFMSIKRAPVNDARPTSVPRLVENRQLDCLWARVIHFGGKVQYAFEVQLGGNIADAIERLEMVAPFVQKAVVVTDDKQKQKITDRLAVKHSPLRDKIVFLSYEDINTVAEAVNALKVFTRCVFHD